MARTPFKMKGSPMKRNFGIGVSPVKQEKGSIDFWNQPSKTKEVDLVKRTTDKLHSTEKSIGELKESRAKDIKKVKGKTVKISKKDVLKQMKKTGSKLKYSDVKKSLTKSISKAGKFVKFVPGLNLVMNLMAESATADQPTKKQGGGKMDPDWLKK